MVTPNIKPHGRGVICGELHGEDGGWAGNILLISFDIYHSTVDTRGSLACDKRDILAFVEFCGQAFALDWLPY